ncbi:MAG: hypothetical protein V1765_00625 [bacterium]
MDKFLKTNFPDLEYLSGLTKHLGRKILAHQSDKELLLMWSGAGLNWIAKCLLDPNVVWTKDELLIDDIYLTGTNPELNKIILEQCNHSPLKLRQLILADPAVVKKIASFKFTPEQVLIRYEEGQYKMLDGMHRVLAAIRDKQEKITAWVGRHQNQVSAPCEPHVIYDLLSNYTRQSKPDRQGLICSLRYLRQNYYNVEGLLKDRFNYDWLPNQDIQDIIKEALKD